ncbi:hypothetical protein EDC14_1004185 [Hydrogenispora ethanolica]|uniref:Uncharacterized protein n=1 Tax=Hydrogenispora ethanolica TaxID=1082276 RepID=A0A4V2QG32_HYDET|nr:hypothetical protein [Hydrogenispora ethanolica]TCL74247.1 hypothetical protein EDC14_1004185 [Hydrogenispora ethanolica]
MAYINGTATSSVDLLDKLRQFLIANGWTVNLFEGDDTGRRLHVRKGTNYVNFKAAVGKPVFPNVSSTTEAANYGIGINPSTGFDSTRDWHSQPGAAADMMDRPIGAAIQLAKTGDIEYHLFSLSEPDAVFVVATSGPINTDPTQNTYQMMVFGNLNKIGSWDGGEFAGASKPGYFMPDSLETSQTRIFSQAVYSTLFVRGDIDAFAKGWLCNCETQTTVQHGNTGKRVIGLLKETNGALTPYALPSYDLLQSKANTVGYTSNVFNALSVNLPFYLLAQRDPNADNIFSPIGTIPHAYYCNTKYLAPGSAYPMDYVDGNDYKVFPFSKKGSAMGYDGIAIRYLP